MSTTTDRWSRQWVDRRPTGLRFTETMTGPVTLGETDPLTGSTRYDDRTTLTFRLTIATNDVRRFLADRQHSATATGWVECEAFGGRSPVTWGEFNLFVEEPAGVRTMRYRLWFTDAAGHALTLRAHKTVVDDRGADVWPDTTTLYTQILVGHVPQTEDETAVVTAAGVLRIPLLAFARQLTTFRTRGASRRDRVTALLRFEGFFLSQLWRTYGGRARSKVRRQS